MQKLGLSPDGFTLPLVVRACSSMGIPKLSRLIHSHVAQMGFQFHLHTNNELVRMYCNLNRMDTARQLFDRMPHRNHVSWNTMISGFSLNYNPRSAYQIFQQMELQGMQPTPVTWTSLLSSHSRCNLHLETMQLFVTMRHRGTSSTPEAVAVVLSSCAEAGSFENGKVTHGYIEKTALDNSIVRNSLISLYGKSRCVKEVRLIFSSMEWKNLITWNALISSLAYAELCDETLSLLVEMQSSGQMPNVITWTSVIDGFASVGRGEDCLQLFCQMQRTGVKGNSVTSASVLSVCAEFAALNSGREVHGHVIRASMEANVLVANGLMNMYMKCGRVDYGLLVFGRFNGRDVISWNIMIDGYGMHGFGAEALQTFDQMVGAGVWPDEVTFIAVLSACSHAGLVAEGRCFLAGMRQHFQIEPNVEHYACFVDLLGRAGFLEEACEVVRSMPVEPNACVWGALLSSCRMSGNTEMAERVTREGFGSLSEATGSHMLLSNIYASCGRWSNSARVRMCVRKNGLKKMAGQSWIEVKRKTYRFSAGETTEGMDEVYHVIQDMALQMDPKDYMLDHRSFLAVTEP